LSKLLPDNFKNPRPENSKEEGNGFEKLDISELWSRSYQKHLAYRFFVFVFNKGEMDITP
jgi:hypothetical protein